MNLWLALPLLMALGGIAAYFAAEASRLRSVLRRLRSVEVFHAASGLRSLASAAERANAVLAGAHERNGEERAALVAAIGEVPLTDPARRTAATGALDDWEEAARERFNAWSALSYWVREGRSIADRIELKAAEGLLGAKP